MFLAFKLSDIVTVPFGWLLGQLYDLTSNYGVAMIIFAIIVQLVILPINAKSKKSMMKMSRLQPRIQEIQRKYENDKQKQNEAIQKLQQEEGASMGCGGCLWSLLPMLILIPLYQVIRQPLVYLLHESVESAEQIIAVVKAGLPDLFTQNNYYDQIISVSAENITKFTSELTGIVTHQRTLEGLNFNFLGIDLGQIPQYNIFASTWSWDWNHIGATLIPILSAGTNVLSMLLSQKSNDSVITNEDGIQDKETAEKSQSAQTSKMMMWMMPIMSLFIGFGVPAALSLYWLIGGLVALVENEIMTKHYRKIYDAEDAEKLKRRLEADRIEEEKERLRAERRAANPEGITENTSKKKLARRQQQEEAAARAAAAREYAAKKGVPTEEEEEGTTALSGIADRPYCKGRAYDPNRYNTESTEE